MEIGSRVVEDRKEGIARAIGAANRCMRLFVGLRGLESVKWGGQNEVYIYDGGKLSR